MDTKEIALRWLNENLSYVDSVTVVDSTGRIIAKQRFNPRYAEEENREHNQWALGKNLLEVYPSLNPEDSTLLQVLNTGKIVYIENQGVWNFQGRKTVCNNINFPIIFRGKIVGAVEISRDITHIENRIHPISPSHTPRPHRNEAARYTLDDIITQDPAMLRLKETIKGLLFGSRKGAFTGAENRKGLFQEADGGTLYLDEINSMPLNLQAKLLRVVQEKQVLPLGSAQSIPVDVRIVSSSNRSQEELLSRGELRPDLLYRLNTVTLAIPPLNQRRGDIPLLCNYFMGKYSRLLGRELPSIAQDTMLFLCNCRWHGNVRELEHTIEAALNVLGEDDTLSLEHLPAYLTMREPLTTSIPAESTTPEIPQPIADLSLTSIQAGEVPPLKEMTNIRHF